MSATGRGATRQPDDNYETPAWAVDALVTSGMLKASLDASFAFDPCAGRGAILKALLGHGIPVTGYELDADRARKAKKLGVQCCNALLHPWPKRTRLIITNPPYSLAMAFVKKALAAIASPYRGQAAFLLRLGWLASQGRSAFHRANPSDLGILEKRPSFVASVKCIGDKLRGGKGGCGWQALFALDEVRPEFCPQCSGDVRVTTTDAADYAWFCWTSPAPRVGTWRVLRLPPSAGVG